MNNGICTCVEQQWNILVTGATGLIGSHIVNKLMDMDAVNVVALSRSEGKLKSVFNNYVGSERFEYIARDVGKPFDFSSITNGRIIDVIFHAASPISGKVVTERPLDVITPNLTALESLLDGLVTQKEQTGISGRIIVFSSATVYGTAHQNEVEVSESDTTQADSLDSTNAAYSETKRMSEVLARAYYNQYGIDALIARIGWVYGFSHFPPETALYQFISSALSRKNIHIRNPYTPKRDNIYIDDVISGLFTILDRGKPGEAYNISSGGKLGNFAAADEIAEIITMISNEEFASEVNVVYKTIEDKSRTPGVVLKSDKLESLGWSLGTSLYEGLKKTILMHSRITKSI